MLDKLLKPRARCGGSHLNKKEKRGKYSNYEFKRVSIRKKNGQARKTC